MLEHHFDITHIALTIQNAYLCPTTLTPSFNIPAFLFRSTTHTSFKTNSVEKRKQSPFERKTKTITSIHIICYIIYMCMVVKKK